MMTYENMNKKCERNWELDIRYLQEPERDEADNSIDQHQDYTSDMEIPF